MHVEVGHEGAVEPVRDSSGVLRYRLVGGERITTLRGPDSGLPDAYQMAVLAVGHHLHPTGSCCWIESSSHALASLLREHFGVWRRDAVAAWGRSVEVQSVAMPALPSSPWIVLRGDDGVVARSAAVLAYTGGVGAYTLSQACVVGEAVVTHADVCDGPDGEAIFTAEFPSAEQAEGVLPVTVTVTPVNTGQSPAQEVRREVALWVPGSSLR